MRSHRVTSYDILPGIIRDQTMISPSYCHAKFFLPQCRWCGRFSIDTNTLIEASKGPIVTVTPGIHAAFVFFVDEHMSTSNQAGASPASQVAEKDRIIWTSHRC